MAKLIEVEERDLDYIFGKSNPYSLDVYQRDYRWSDDKDYKIVTQLLIDIELRFENNLLVNRKYQKDELTLIYKDVNENFKAYFLNTIMLNEQGGNIFIVDGQQRLTTILLILIKLFHIGKNNVINSMNVDKLLGEKIFEEDKSGKKHFKISNKDRNDVIEKIFKNEEILTTDITNITQKNLKDNYAIISKYFDKYFFDKEGKIDAIKYNYYIYNLTEKVLIIEQVIKDKSDVAMIFETANDRGKELEPHEVLKGMLLGVLENDVKEDCNTIWNEALKTFYDEDGNYEDVDEFFRTYFRSKYVDNISQYLTFSGKYHRNLLSNNKIIKDLDRSNPKKIEAFIKKDFKYFYKAYLKIWKTAFNEKNIFVTSNYANEQSSQFLLILSALKLNDPDEDAKISLVAKKIDQFYTVSRLIGHYWDKDQKIIMELNKEIRNKSLADIDVSFDKVMVAYYNSKNITVANFNDIFQYDNFKNSKIDGRFTKIVLARVDNYLADLLNEQSFSKQEKIYFIANSGNSPVNGFHLEHMFANEDKIMNQFKDKNGDFDEKLFNEQRNRLGALILLKGNENLRTGNWIFKKKFKSYVNSGFIWNRILTNSINPASLNNCTDPIKNSFKNYEPDVDGLLTKDAIEERQLLLFQLVKKIYSN
jgi:uncharacterized protein with ParB-like and HNH nuclease domain